MEYLKRLHAGLTPEPLSCRDCHEQGSSYLPLRKLGYTEQRRQELVGSAVIGLIEKYDRHEKFYLPRLFAPRQEAAP